MIELAREIIPTAIEDELQQSYLDYAMSVIVGRALPDIRDGLKPVHRRILYAMNELGNDWNKPYKKSARIVGDVIGKYHPHGDVAVYDAIVRMAQVFSLRYLLIDGQGNFGSVDGDAPAAMRYTEIRLSRFAHALMADIEKETVDYTPNYDETEMIPSVLPARIPNLLVNGSSGIAVGMATNIPPHNLNEVINATLALINDADLTVEELMYHVPGPDFPTSGIINGHSGIVQAYKTGRGRICVRAKADIETIKGGRSQIIISELPYQVNKARLLEKIKRLVQEKKIEGISVLRDESDKCGMRIMIEVIRGDHAEVVLNNLYSQTQLQTVFGINMVALDEDGQPRVLNLKQLLSAFLQHRRDVVMRRTLFELRKARKRAHVLEGLWIALTNINEIINLIKETKTPKISKERLSTKVWQPGKVLNLLKKFGNNRTRPENLDAKYGLQTDGYRISLVQAQAILDLRLHRLTRLESNQISEEYITLIDHISTLTSIISDSDKLHQVIRDELIEIKARFGDERRTKIFDVQLDLTNEDLIPEESLVVTLSYSGYIKSQSLSSYQAQHRGGRGKMATAVKDQDFVKSILVANSHDTILCFSTYGKVYWLKVYQVPQSSRVSYGRPVVNLLPLSDDEYISAILPIRYCNKSHFIFMTTAKGSVKKVVSSEFFQSRMNGKIALTLKTEDRLVGVDITDGNKEVMLITDAGKAIRFHESEVRAMGRTAHGVCGIKLKENQSVISLIIVKPGGYILTATSHGYGQRTAIESYRSTSRGGQGVIAIRINRRNGNVVSATQVFNNYEVLLISNKGTLVRIRVNEVSQMGRNTQGVRLIQLAQEEILVGMEAISVEELIKQ
ncbi:DNA gyrase subunit A [Coxiella endosymbiont of Amblyomma americanum]|uniref:DNA gyrase subunit A n=1 Tax=Coxiella endosymbiont of Amblyomma americanum TaxID=325775 RepID=UPI00057DAC8B|nr:DNA gyrase subunit A [Coxiella endosymbiont of Amblyomma americanum]AJC50652.1 DNA gyrase subunit A [Coxiella endosymbiont of Amblyomma americanum]AUJ58980.1 DNA gyrase subunit A [Coxiella-like endosymbiont of Amblyomma americanum]